MKGWLWSFRYWKSKKRENFLLWISRHLPNSVVYWTVIWAATHNGDGSPFPNNPAERTVVDVLKHGGWKA